MLSYAWLIPAITLVSFVVILFFGKRMPLKGAEVGVFALGLSLLLSVGMAFTWIGRDATLKVEPHAVVSGEGDHPVEEDHEEDAGHAEEDAHAEDEAHRAETDDEHAEEEAATETKDEHATTDDDHGDEAAAGTAPEEGGHGEAETVGEDGGHGEAGEHGAEAIRAPVVEEVTWFTNGDVEVKAGIHIDGLAVAMLVVVSTISFLVHVFSTSYMHGDERFTHYYAALSLFTTGMFVLVTASNTLQALFGWELMGLCSFMLIGHWWDRDGDKNSRAALKAFFTTRTGDVGLLIGISALFFAVGQSFDIAHTNEVALSGTVSHGLLLAGASALLIAVIGKSAQFPLHTWLPDAMAGPTPVSALIHAATMVVAGVYLVARLYGVFWEAFDIGGGGLNPVALVGGITILIAAALAFVQSDIKKVLAYSTVSQLGFMVMALGVGAWTAGVFHLFTHAFFKACLFLGAGSVAHSGSHHSFDMVKDMGGLKDHMPWTYRTFLIGSAALAGIPPLAGFWSKDEILLGAGENGYTAFLVVGLVGAFMTAAYMTRCIYLTFHGEARGAAAHHHPHESPATIVVPLQVLAVLSIFAGFLNFPSHSAEWFGKWTENATILAANIHPHQFSIVTALFSVAVAAGGIGTAYAYYWRGFRVSSLRHDTGLPGRVYRLLVERYYLDDLYEKVVVAGISGPVARGAYWINQRVIDGVVNAMGIIARAVARFVYDVLDQRVVDGLVNGVGMASEEAGAGLRLSQTGKVQQYAAAMVLATLAFAGALLLFV